MKKLVLILSSCFITSFGFAQTAIQTTKTFDNVYIGSQVGVSTPMSFNSTFPLNTQFGIKVGKNFTPVLGFNIEGDMWFGSASDNQSRFSYKNGIRATNVGVNATFDMFNWIAGYNANRLFTIVPEVGIGWLHTFNSNASDANYLSSKTGIQFAFNLGSEKSWQVYAEPTVWWNLNKSHDIQFNKNNSQLGLQLGFIYKFKTSNGTHNFVSWNVGEMNKQINLLHAEVDSLNAIKPDTITVIKTQVVHDTIYIESTNPYFVCFAQNSYELTDEAKAILDSIPTNITVKVSATASPEGTKKYNQTLSEKRAKAVSEYLSNRGITVVSTEGLGVLNNTSNRIATISTY